MTFDREFVVGPGASYNVENQASLKIASNQPFEAGVMSPAVAVQPGDAQGNEIVVMLQGHSPDALNSNIYFDNVQIYINGVALANCRG